MAKTIRQRKPNAKRFKIFLAICELAFKGYYTIGNEGQKAGISNILCTIDQLKKTA